MLKRQRPTENFKLAADLSEYERLTHRISIQYQATRILSESSSRDEAIAKILETIGSGLNWEVGAYWAVNLKENLIQCKETWISPSTQVPQFEKITKQSKFQSGEGLPGRVWQKGQAIWVENVTADSNFPRASIAAQEGLRGSMAFPISIAQEFFGVMEFFSQTIQTSDTDLLKIMDSIGTQIGQFLERTLAQEAIQNSDAQKAAILETALDSIVSMDCQGRITEFNSAAERMFGHTRDEVLGKEMAEVIIPPAFRSAHCKGLSRFLATGEGPVLGMRVELLGMRHDGSTFPVELAITHYRIKDIPMFTGHIRDITERKRTEEALKESEQQFRTLADTIPQLVWMAQEDGSVFWYNKRWYDYTGATPGQMEGWDWQSLHDPLDLPRILEQWRTALRTGQPLDIEFSLKGANGHYRWFLTRVTPVRNTQGEIVRWFGTNTDIDDQKKYQEELAKAVKSRDEFLSIASHELKTPLTSLKMQAQIRKRTLAKGDLSRFTPEGLQRMANDDEKQVNRLIRLVDDMLDISRLSTGKFALQLEQTDLSALVKEVIDRFSLELQSLGSAVFLDSCDSVIGNWDRYRLEQVFTNLLTNAMKYGDNKSIHVSIGIQDSKANLTITDQGIGIAKKDQERIFQQYERAISGTSISGLGLGLYIVKQIVESHGGRIWVESELGHGSSFIVELPLNNERSV